MTNIKQTIIVTLAILGIAGFVYASGILYPAQGGTGWGSLQSNTLLTGNGTSQIATTTIGSGLTLSGGILSASGGVYPFTPTTNLGLVMSATSTNLFTTGSAGYYASGVSSFASTTVTTLNVGVLTASSSAYLGSLTLGTKLANAQLANSSFIVTTASPLGGAATINLGDTLALTCTTCAIGTINSGTTNQIAFYSGATTLSSSGAIVIASNGVGSSTIPVLNIGTLTATSGTSYIQALTVANGFTVTAGSVSLPAGSVANAALAFSTISGVALGGTLGALTATNATLTFSASYTGAAAATVGLNLGNANAWTASQSFSASSTFSGLTFHGGNLIVTGGLLGIGSSTPTFALTLASTTAISDECPFIEASAVSIDLSKCQRSKIIAGGTVTVTVTNIRPGITGSIMACQDGTGGRTWVWDNALLHFNNGSSTGITQTPNKCAILSFIGSSATSTGRTGQLFIGVAQPF